jgi:hypothetical protein
MEKKQTAVEYLEEKLFYWLSPEKREPLLRHIVLAKAIEKAQSRKDYYGGVRDEMQNIGSDFEDYYNKTYANDTTKGLPEENSKRRGWHY